MPSKPEINKSVELLSKKFDDIVSILNILEKLGKNVAMTDINIGKAVSVAKHGSILANELIEANIEEESRYRRLLSDTISIMKPFVSEYYHHRNHTAHEFYPPETGSIAFTYFERLAKLDLALKAIFEDDVAIGKCFHLQERFREEKTTELGIVIKTRTICEECGEVTESSENKEIEEKTL